MSFVARKANRKQVSLKIGVSGTAGAGKTYSALKLAFGLSDDWNKIILIDTENGSGELYSDLGEYQVIPFDPPYSPERWVECFNYAESLDPAVIIADSVSSEWEGVGGVLDVIDKISSQTRNGLQSWAQVTPRHRKFLDKILALRCHAILTTRRKTDWAMSNDEKGKIRPEKIGLKATQRDGFDYELTIDFALDQRHLAIANKDRTGLFADRDPFVISEETGIEIVKWNATGAIDPIKAQYFEQLKEIQAKYEEADIKLAEKYNKYYSAMKNLEKKGDFKRAIDAVKWFEDSFEKAVSEKWQELEKVEEPESVELEKVDCSKMQEYTNKRLSELMQHLKIVNFKSFENMLGEDIEEIKEIVLNPDISDQQKKTTIDDFIADVKIKFSSGQLGLE